MRHDLATLAVILGAILLGLLMLAVAVARVVREVSRWWRRSLTRRLVRWLFGRAGGGQRRAPRPPVLTGDDIYLACPLSAWQGGPWACRWCNGLLPQRATRWCRPQCRTAARENHVFSGPGGACEAALRRDGYRCVRCGSAGSHEHALQVNHRIPIRGRHKVAGCHHHLEPGPDGRSGLETLCSGPGSCHQDETNRQRARGWAA